MQQSVMWWLWLWQGLVAGMNAARRAQGLEVVTLPRNSSYIGTLVDDLVTKVKPASGQTNT